MISEDNFLRVQEELADVAIRVIRIDVDGFLEVAEAVGSPQALAAGYTPRAVTLAAQWAEIARLVKPFRDRVVADVAAFRNALPEDDTELAPEEASCPKCGERRVDELTLNDDDTVVCATCGHRYALPPRVSAELRHEDFVVCDCAPATNPGCKIGDHAEHLVRAVWRARRKADAEEFMYLCGVCAESISEGPDAGEWDLERLADDRP